MRDTSTAAILSAIFLFGRPLATCQLVDPCICHRRCSGNIVTVRLFPQFIYLFIRYPNDHSRPVRCMRWVFWDPVVGLWLFRIYVLMTILARFCIWKTQSPIPAFWGLQWFINKNKINTYIRTFQMTIQLPSMFVSTIMGIGPFTSCIWSFF